jgi:CBS domain-containing protein
MNVNDVCQRNVVTIRPNQSLTVAAELMRERHVGYLVVTESEPSGGPQLPVGVLTDRDIVIGVLAPGANVQQLSVSEVMTRKPVVVRETDSVAVALLEMRRIGVRRLPVLSSGGQLCGVLSLDDIIDSIAGYLTDAAQAIRHEQHLESALRP